LLGTFDLTGIPPAPRGVPQIEVTFDVNADGIMNVSAQDKSTGNVKKITIKNEKGRLSQADIDRMVADAEKFKSQDEELKKKVEAKNALEGYCFGVRNSINQEQFAAALKPEDKEKIQKEINDTLAWIEANKEAEVAVFEAKQKELEAKLMPLLQAAYQGAAGGGAGGPGGFPGGDGGGFPGGAGGFPGGIDPNMFQGGRGGGAPPPTGGGGGGRGGPRVEEVDLRTKQCIFGRWFVARFAGRFVTLGEPRNAANQFEGVRELCLAGERLKDSIEWTNSIELKG
jgi:L1 cell adhesion molecule like protein